MKKIIFSFLLCILVSSKCFGGTISISPFISSNDVTIASLETQRTTFSNVINGNIESVNILDGTIASADESVAISIVKFRDESFNDFTASGMLAPTSGTLSSTISAGVSYVNGVRVEIAAQAHTYTASKDTYGYVTAGGSYTFEEVANGAAAPTTPANSLLLFKAVTSGTAITSVSDLRTTSIQITANSSNLSFNYRNEAFAVRDSTTAVHLEPGQIAIGNTFYTNNADSSSRSTATASNWIEGAVPSLVNQKFFVYAYNNSGTTYDFKYSSADPTETDVDGGATGTLRFYETGGVTYRILGWASGDSTGAIQTTAFGNVADGTVVNQVIHQTGAVATGAVVQVSDDTIPTNIEGNQFLQATFRPTNANNKLVIDVLIHFQSSANGANPVVSLLKDSDATAIAAAREENGSGGLLNQVSLRHTMTAGTINPISFAVRASDTGASTTTLNGTGGGRLFGGVCASSLTITEIEGNQ